MFITSLTVFSATYSITLISNSLCLKAKVSMISSYLLSITPTITFSLVPTLDPSHYNPSLIVYISNLNADSRPYNAANLSTCSTHYQYSADISVITLNRII